MSRSKLPPKGTTKSHVYVQHPTLESPQAPGYMRLHQNPAGNAYGRQPLVSVAVITYNHGKFIGECLDGILMQKTTFDFEIVVAEDCSTDDTRKVIRAYEQKYPNIIRGIYQDKNVGGVRNAYEYCYPSLRGKYIALCEGDDFWTDPEKLQKQVDFLEQHPDYVLSFHRVNSVDVHGNLIQAQPVSDEKRYRQAQMFHVFVPTLSMVFRKVFDEVPSEMFRVKSCDTFLCGLLATYGKAVDMGFIGASYRSHPGGVYSSLQYVNQVKQGIQTRNRMILCPQFRIGYKLEVGKEILTRKIRYIKHALRKKELVNGLKVAVA